MQKNSTEKVMKHIGIIKYVQYNNQNTIKQLEKS